MRLTIPRTMRVHQLMIHALQSNKPSTKYPQLEPTLGGDA